MPYLGHWPDLNGYLWKLYELHSRYDYQLQSISWQIYWLILSSTFEEYSIDKLKTNKRSLPSSLVNSVLLKIISLKWNLIISACLVSSFKIYCYLLYYSAFSVYYLQRYLTFVRSFSSQIYVCFSKQNASYEDKKTILRLNTVIRRYSSSNFPAILASSTNSFCVVRYQTIINENAIFYPYIPACLLSISCFLIWSDSQVSGIPFLVWNCLWRAVLT